MDADSQLRSRLRRFGTQFGTPDRTSVIVSLAFLGIAALLTWPLLIRPGQLYLTAPTEYEISQAADYRYVEYAVRQRDDLVLDHAIHVNAAADAADRLRNGRIPFEVDPGYAVPPTYVLLSAVLTVLVPIRQIVVHNLFFVGSVFLAGVFAYRFVAEVVDDRETAFLAGVLYMSSFYAFGAYMLGHTNQWQLQWIPLVLFATERLRAQPSGRTIALLGAAFALQVLSSEQYAVYLSFVLPLYCLVRYACGATGFRRRSFVGGFAAATVLGAIATVPYLLARGSAAATGATETYSIATNAYWGNVLEFWNLPGVFFAADAPLQFLFRLVLLFLGTVALVTATPRRQRRLLPFVFLFGFGLVLSWGPFAGWAPYTLLYRYWPLVEYFRVPYRMLPFALLGASAISAAGVCHAIEPDPESGDSWTRRGRLAIAVIVLVQLVLVHYSLQFAPYSL